MLSRVSMCDLFNDKVQQSMLFLSPAVSSSGGVNAITLSSLRGRFAHTTGIPDAIDSIGG